MMLADINIFSPTASALAGGGDWEEAVKLLQVNRNRQHYTLLGFGFTPPPPPVGLYARL